MSSLRARGWGRGETNRCAISSIRERGTHTHTHRERRGIMFSKSILLRPGLPQISESLSLKNWSIRCTYKYRVLFGSRYDLFAPQPPPKQAISNCIWTWSDLRWTGRTSPPTFVQISQARPALPQSPSLPFLFFHFSFPRSFTAQISLSHLEIWAVRRASEEREGGGEKINAKFLSG